MVKIIKVKITQKMCNHVNEVIDICFTPEEQKLLKIKKHKPHTIKVLVK